jgi:hypothetical protein
LKRGLLIALFLCGCGRAPEYVGVPSPTPPVQQEREHIRVVPGNTQPLAMPQMALPEEEPQDIPPTPTPTPIATGTPDYTKVLEQMRSVPTPVDPTDPAQNSAYLNQIGSKLKHP